MKRFPALFLCLCLTCALLVSGLLPGTLPAAKAALGTGVLYVAGQDIVQAPNYTVSGGGGTATLSYDSSDNPVITLNNFKYSGTGFLYNNTCSPIYYSGNSPLTLKLVETNEIFCDGNTDDLCIGLYSLKANLTITGTGSLKVVGSNSKSNTRGRGIDTGSAGIIIQDCTGLVEVTGSDIGINTSTKISIVNSKVTVEGTYSYGICSNASNITITNSTVTVKKNGIFAFGTLQISGNSTVEASVPASSEETAIETKSAPTLTRVYISTPADGEFINKSGSYEVFAPEATSPAKKVIIQPFPAGKYHLVYDANGGTGHMNSTWVAEHDKYYYPECTFIAPQSMKFGHWKMSGVDGIYYKDEDVTIASNCADSNGLITVTAHWVYAAQATVVTDPEAKDLTYTGSPQPLVTAGQARDGTMAYVLGTDSTKAPKYDWNADIPAETDAGTYYVWYKAAGDDTHSDSDPKCVPVILKKATPDAPPAPTAESVTTTGVTLKKIAGYQYCMEGTAWQNSNVFDGLTKNTKYTFYQRIAGDDNHEPSPASEGTDITTEDVSYEAVNAEGTEQTSGAIRELVVQVKRSKDDDQTFDSYTGAAMDGKAIPKEQTATAKGSLILTISKDYMASLAVGSHKLTVSFRDGSVEIPVTIHAAPTPSPTPKPTPKTGDPANLPLWGFVILLGLAGIVVVIKQH